MELSAFLDDVIKWADERLDVVGLALVWGLLYVRWVFALPVCVLDGSAPIAALRQSFRLTRGSVVRLVGFLALWLVVAYFSVVRFLSYLDIRIRREGWEVELVMRAENQRLAGPETVWRT